MRILLVEDDPMIGESIRDGLRPDGFAVDWLRAGTSVLSALQNEPYVLLLLDLGLPGVSGLEILRAVRAKAMAIPILIITARNAVADRVAGLDAGADDYLTKPFTLEELAARMRALLRRQTGRTEPLIVRGALTLNPVTHELTHRGASVVLSARELALMHCLLERPGAIVPRARLEERLYGWGEEVESNTVEVHIHRLRRKLGAEVIRTVRGVGYMIPKNP
ncbi:MAG TPA: response regulator transcription factor [Steroidobacteraceae bacterium]|jgi:two-component system response regulator QseB|nr:response regulator transcription factor [Steroidobacteraceae bacterium]